MSAVKILEKEIAPIGQRMVNAEIAIIDNISRLGNIDRVFAVKVFGYYTKHKLVKFNGSSYMVKHGALLEKKIIRRAIELL